MSGSVPVQPPVPAASVAPSSVTPVTTGGVVDCGGSALTGPPPAGAETAWASPAELDAWTDDDDLVADVVARERVAAAGLRRG